MLPRGSRPTSDQGRPILSQPLLIAAVSAAILAPSAHPNPLPPGCEQGVTAGQVRAFETKVWRLVLWERGKPPERVREAHREHVLCAAGPGHRKAIRRSWRSAKKEFREHRKGKLETHRWEPYVCGGRHYALPCAVTECESGFYFGHHSGAYGILDSTWAYWGGGRFAPYPGAATPRQQAIVARRVWEAVGPSGWECPL